MAQLSFKPKQVTKKILSSLQERAFDVVSHRFGLGVDATPKTLEAIGQTYGITRERVRQIENAALATIRKSDAYKNEQKTFDELRDIMKNHGSLVNEKDFLETLAKDKNTQNHLHFYLVLGEYFKKHKEDEAFHHRWTIDTELANSVHDSLSTLYKKLSDEELLSETEIVDTFISVMKDIADE
ncbi:MAG: sigma factor-like helix-turn-helix DNA-binding protein, partial [Minisyncoccia bacterium]